MRINAYLARAGVSSRRGADKLIAGGRVKINGRTAELNDQVGEDDTVELDGQAVQAQKLRYILLNKPVGFVTTLKDPQNRPKVTDLVRVPERVVPVGRLDFNTSGLLLLTNDGELAHGLSHPSTEFKKTYIVSFRGELGAQAIKDLESGISLEDGMTAPAEVRKLDEQTFKITIHEGRNRQVRRMAAALGLKLTGLHRAHYGPIGLEGLKPGQWRELTDEEVGLLRDTIATNGKRKKPEKEG